MLGPLYLFVFLLISLKSIAGEDLYTYLFQSRNYPKSLSQSIRLAEKEQDRVKLLIREVSGAALFLPTNNAWDKKPQWIEALIDEPEGNVRYDVILAASSDAGSAGISSSWEAIQEQAKLNGGVVDSAYGTPYFVKFDGTNGSVCLAVWEQDTYVEGNCATVILPPIKLSDATIYQIDSILVPNRLEQDIEDLKHRLFD